MASQPLSALLLQILSSCQLNGTSITESGISVSTNKLPGEIISFFRIDSDSGRNSLGMVGLPCCDCLIFYTKQGTIRELVCFLELKAAGLKAAKQQIMSVYPKIKQLIDENRLQSTTLTACICMRHQAPLGDLRYADELKKTFGRENVHLKFGVRHYEGLGQFMRGRIA